MPRNFCACMLLSRDLRWKWKSEKSEIHIFVFFVFTLAVLNLDNKLIVFALLLHSSCETAMGDLKWTQHKARYCQQQIFSRRQGWHLMLRRTKDLYQRWVESCYNTNLKCEMINSRSSMGFKWEPCGRKSKIGDTIGQQGASSRGWS